MSIFLSLFTAISFFLIKYFNFQFNNYLGVLSVVTIFSLFDWIKGNILWGFPWIPISSIWTFDESTISIFSIIGIWGYSFVTYSLILGIYSIKYNYKISIFFFSPFIFFFCLANFILKPEIKEIDDLLIRLVQPNIKQEDKWDIEKTEKNLSTLINLSNKSSDKEIDLIIWPETAVAYNIEKSKKKNDFLISKLNNFNNLILGSIRRDFKDEQNLIYNSLFLIQDKFKRIQHHDKLKLVPFGEYIPFRGFLNKRQLTLGGLDFTVGDKIKILKLNDKVKILPLICYEVIFPNISRKKSNNYNILVNITNDAWYGKSRGPYQHLELSKIRAVLEGKYLIRVANTGISAIINHNGTVENHLKLTQSGIIDKELVLTKKNTLYSKLGETFFFSALLLSFLIIIFNLNRRSGNKHE